MSDRKLLERAAKAAGITGEWGDVFPLGDTGDTYDFTDLFFLENDEGIWNPLLDDGDAFRLAVKLRLDLSHFESFVDCERRGGDIWPAYDSHHGGDRCAATRRAIVRAAAALAKDPT